MKAVQRQRAGMRCSRPDWLRASALSATRIAKRAAELKTPDEAVEPLNGRLGGGGASSGAWVGAAAGAIRSWALGVDESAEAVDAHTAAADVCAARLRSAVPMVSRAWTAPAPGFSAREIAG